MNIKFYDNNAVIDKHKIKLTYRSSYSYATLVNLKNTFETLYNNMDFNIIESKYGISYIKVFCEDDTLINNIYPAIQMMYLFTPFKLINYDLKKTIFKRINYIYHIDTFVNLTRPNIQYSDIGKQYIEFIKKIKFAYNLYHNQYPEEKYYFKNNDTVLTDMSTNSNNVLNYITKFCYILYWKSNKDTKKNINYINTLIKNIKNNIINDRDYNNPIYNHYKYKYSDNIITSDKVNILLDLMNNIITTFPISDKEIENHILQFLLLTKMERG